MLSSEKSLYLRRILRKIYYPKATIMRVIDMKLRESKDLNLIIVKGKKEHDIARGLIQEYADSLDVSLEFENIDKELKHLSRFYRPPFNLIIMAKTDDEFVGVACLRDLGHFVAEIKRMYVKPDYRGKGLGRKILGKLVEEAQKLDYRFLRLDAVPDMESAIHLFRSNGFYEIEDYGSNPFDGARFMELKL